MMDSESGAGGTIDAQRLCDAASAVFFAILRHQARVDGRPAQVPMLLCPRSIPACPCRFTKAEILEAEAFLIRMGVIERRCEIGVSRMRVCDDTSSDG